MSDPSDNIPLDPYNLKFSVAARLRIVAVSLSLCALTKSSTILMPATSPGYKSTLLPSSGWSKPIICFSAVVVFEVQANNVAATKKLKNTFFIIYVFNE